MFKNLKGLYYIFLVLSTIFFISACSVTDNLSSNEYLLYKQKIVGNKKIPTDPLTAIFKQKTNRKILGTMPYLGIYYIGEKFYDSTKIANKLKQTQEKYEQKINATTQKKKKEKLKNRKKKKTTRLKEKLKEGNWLMRVPGEPPTIYDSSLTSLTTQQLGNFLYSKGFFSGSVTTEIDTSGKKVNVKYKMDEGTAYIIKEINYKIENEKIDSILKRRRREPLLKVGDRYDATILSNERDRINDLLKNKGYYDFSRQYIFFNIDTTQGNHSVFIDVVVENPSKGQKHKQYTVSKVVFVGNSEKVSVNKEDTTTYRNMYFVLPEQNYSRRILSDKITIKPGELYSQKDIQIAQRQLANLDMFKFVNINFKKNKTDSTANTLTAYIRTSPLKKFQITDEIGITVSSAGFIPGPVGNLSFKTRNTFGGFELFEINLKAAVEGYSSFSDPDVFLKTQELTGNSSLSFPEILFPVKKVRGLFKDYAPKTKLLIGATLIKRPEYDRLNIKNSLSYIWLTTPSKVFNYSILDVNVINTLRTDPAFIARLQKQQDELGSNLIYSFNNSFVSNTNFSYTFNNNDFSKNRKSKYFKLYLESGGLIFNLNKLAPKDSIFGLKTFSYLKGNCDLRLYFPQSKKNTFAIRLNVGIAYPYDKIGVLPYEKYFFAGGGNSIRAWKPRRLGPGGYEQTNPDGEKTDQYEQPGELLIENNYEYRFHIISFLDGALFVDAGNVWNIKKQTADAKPGSLFKFNTFYKQIAIGTGFGLRFNFSFLILRFDVGIKAYDPAQPKGERYVLPEILKKPFQIAVPQLGLGYPF